MRAHGAGQILLFQVCVDHPGCEYGQPKGFALYKQYVKKLDPVGQSFFENQFDDPEYPTN